MSTTFEKNKILTLHIRIVQVQEDGRTRRVVRSELICRGSSLSRMGKINWCVGAGYEDILVEADRKTDCIATICYYENLCMHAGSCSGMCMSTGWSKL
jgi:hypothetical protein